MYCAEFNGERVLELGCGIGLASLVLQQRGVDIVASDVHPMTEPFLAYNAALNALPALHYRQLRWDVPLPSLGYFDVIIASDVLYESTHAELVSGVIQRHARDSAQVWITDPGRGNNGRFNRLMQSQGYLADPLRFPANDDDPTPCRGRLLRYRRGDAGRPV